MKIVQVALTPLILFCIVLAGTGCASDQATQKKLADGKVALEQKQYDQAIRQADSILQNKGSNVDTAAAYYLKGRAIEQRVKADPGSADQDLTLAKTNYNRALQLGPPKKLEGYLRSSLANVGFFQNDYNTAFEQWSKAYDLLEEQDLKAWALYRIGISQQRLGRFDHADKTFSAVQTVYPGTEQARRAKEHQGATGFYVQLATFKNASSADNAIKELKQQGVTATKTTDPRGLSIVRVGPVNTYAEAQQLQGRFTAKYADALIIP